MMILESIVVLINAVALIGTMAATPCDLTALSKLLVNQNVISCRADTGYNPASTTAVTDAQIAAVCSSNACTQAVNELKGVAPNECTIGPLRLYGDIINPLEQRCGRNTMTNATGSASASASGSGPMVGDVGSASVTGSAANSTTITKPRTDPAATPRTEPPSPSPSPNNGGTDVSACSLAAATAALVVVAVIF
ncbi:hypothetical protein CCR75_000375 [Bremia lactucae]|uniref:Elicitin n=1 Tax=Bremia lactucae TaxID=4779 RepID=A0A976FP89_BRELC|nr:hypothetical protein CCR75_000375 [Bremia lactucae]